MVIEFETEYYRVNGHVYLIRTRLYPTTVVPKDLGEYYLVEAYFCGDDFMLRIFIFRTYVVGQNIRDAEIKAANMLGKIIGENDRNLVKALVKDYE